MQTAECSAYQRTVELPHGAPWLVAVRKNEGQYIKSQDGKSPISGLRILLLHHSSDQFSQSPSHPQASTKHTMSLFFPSYDHIPSLATAHAHLEHQKAEAKASHKRVTSMPLILDKDLQLLSAVPSTPQNAMSEVDHLAAPAALRGAAMDPMVAPGGVSAEQTDSSQAALIDNKKLVKRLQRNLVGSWECLSCTLTPIPTQDNNAESSEIVHVLTEKPNGNLIYT